MERVVREKSERHTEDCGDGAWVVLRSNHNNNNNMIFIRRTDKPL